jgi:hypothetical protein
MPLVYPSCAYYTRKHSNSLIVCLTNKFDSESMKSNDVSEDIICRGIVIGAETSIWSS